VPACGVEDNPIGIGHRGKGAKNGKRLQIEDHDGPITATVADEPASCRGSERHAMSVFLARNVGYGLAGIGVDHHLTIGSVPWHRPSACGGQAKGLSYKAPHNQRAAARIGVRRNETTTVRPGSSSALAG
jgi:hypothetical protein